MYPELSMNQIKLSFIRAALKYKNCFKNGLAKNCLNCLSTCVI